MKHPRGWLAQHALTSLGYYDGKKSGIWGPKTQAAYDKAVSCDGKTITFNLKVPVADFNYTTTLLSFSPVPKAADTGEKYDMKPVSSGPYKIESYEPGKSLVLVRNENWSKASDPIRNAYADSFVYEFEELTGYPPDEGVQVAFTVGEKTSKGRFGL